MKGTIKTLLLSTSMAVGMSAIATGSALAASLSNVQMFGSDYAVYGATDAASALTDGDRYSHVELNYANENLLNNNTGFTANLGVDSIKVEGITQADWNGGLAAKWMADFSAVYPTVAAAFQQVQAMTGGTVNLFNQIAQRSGDPNVSYMVKDDATGAITMDLIGHYNVWDAPWMTPYANNPLVAQLKATTPVLQISEIAKVTVNGVSSFAYSFSAQATGVVAADAALGDSSSHSGRYTIALQGSIEPPPESEDVPEPSLMLGLAAVGGLVAASKRKSQQA